MSRYPNPEFNPYAPPKEVPAPGYYQPPPPLHDPLFGLFRQGNLLVMHKLAPLPDRCVKSNQPADGRTLRRNLRWHPPFIYLTIPAGVLIYAILASILSKTADIRIGLSPKWIGIRRRIILTAWGLVLLSVVLFVGSIMGLSNSQPQDPGVWPWVMLGSIVMFFGGAMYGIIAARLVTPSKITDTHLWLKGVHRDYLAELPVWPYPY